ncbi:hypothetical protein POM88_016012 [Heracleum sosnowskyi]|uniref:Uncharacterized protein n=1 Tax=Heracleum sosnowskyi TaxID=360622 RepID=A0AAD8IKX4_9APIA|nr:hypothetical protein POM88_016012 [Heracleum sosnowskyi]
MFMEVPRSIGCLKNLEILALPFQAKGADLNMCSILKNTRFIPASVWCLFSLKNLNLSDCFLFDLPDSIRDLSSLQHLNLSRNCFLILTSSLGQLSNLKTLTLTGCKSLWAILELPPNLTDLYASYCTSLKTLVVAKLSHLRCLYLSYCSSLVEIEGMDKLKSITRLDMAGCENLSITFEESLFQASTSIYFKKFIKYAASVPNRFLGIILWLNVDQPTQITQATDLSDFWVFFHVVSQRLIYPRQWFCETSTWKPVPQSWVTLIPRAVFPMFSGETIEVSSVKDDIRLESIGGHLMYE